MPTSILELNERVKAAPGTLPFIIPQSGFSFQSIIYMKLFSSLRKPASCLSLFSDFLGIRPREWFRGPWPGGSGRQRDRSASGLSRPGTPVFLAHLLRACQGQVLAMSTPHSVSGPWGSLLRAFPRAAPGRNAFGPQNLQVNKSSDVV